MELDFSSKIKGLTSYKRLYIDIINETMSVLNLSFKPILSVSIIDEELIHEINRDYRNVDRVTDVISFAFLDGVNNKEQLFKVDEFLDLGEIYICYEKAKQQALEYGHSLKREMAFLFTHGFLHLLGYDHMNGKDEKIMFELTEKILTNRGIKR